MRYTLVALVVLVVAVSACQPVRPEPARVLPPLKLAPPPPARTVRERPAAITLDAPMHFTATAYALEGITKCGTRARRGIVAADPRVIPLRSKIRVSNAGSYSGVYLVEDTGSLIKGRIIDIKMGSSVECRKFGRQTVTVEVLRWGPEVEASAK
jgi:3D (Asp-Asp-Asp) domain-containing protein